MWVRERKRACARENGRESVFEKEGHFYFHEYAICNNECHKRNKKILLCAWVSEWRTNWLLVNRSRRSLKKSRFKFTYFRTSLLTDKNVQRVPSLLKKFMCDILILNSAHFYVMLAHEILYIIRCLCLILFPWREIIYSCESKVILFKTSCQMTHKEISM